MERRGGHTPRSFCVPSNGKNPPKPHSKCYILRSQLHLSSSYWFWLRSYGSHGAIFLSSTPVLSVNNKREGVSRC